MTADQQNKMPAFEVDGFNEKKSRLRAIQVIALVCFAVILVRLIQIQIIDSEYYKERVQKQVEAKHPLPAARGILYDRKGNVLASNYRSVSFAADPKMVGKNADSIAKTFARVFNKPKSHYLQKLREDTRFVWLERMVDVKYLKSINLKKMPGIVPQIESKRIYFNDYLAGQLIGATTIDNVGVSGIEQQYNTELSGEDGCVTFQRDGRRRTRPSVDYPRIEPRDGDNIYLTLDIGLQAIAEKELKRGIEQNQVERGLVIILQPRTGEILAMAQYPKIDPNNFGKYESEDQKLRAVTDMYEPGSIFKIVTASAALEHDLVRPEKIFNAEKGSYKVYVPRKLKPRIISDTHKAEHLTFQEAMEVSSNIVMAKISDIVGAERFYKMARDYGFGTATNIEYPGEVNGVLKKPISWSATSLNTMAYGYEVGVTPLQIASAYAAIANDGVLMQPMLFKKEVDPSGNVIREGRQQKIRRVISSSTSETMDQFLVGVVERGTATPAKINNVRVAGKTGTSKKIVDGKYTTGEYIASFVGYFPVEDPQIVCLVMMDKPKGSSYYGGTVSAPVFRSIAEQILTTTELSSRISPVMPPVDSGIASGAANKPGRVKATDSVPDVRGLSLRKAIETLKSHGLTPKVKGSGIVASQSPAAGTRKTKGMKISLVCQEPTGPSLGMNYRPGDRR